MLFNAKRLGVTLGLCDGVEGKCRTGIEISAKNKSKLKSSISNSSNFDYVVINGGDEHINRLATSDKRVDILAHPDAGRKDPGVDSFVAEQAHKNGVAIEVNLRNLVLTKGNRRVNALKNVARTLKLSRKYGFDIIVTSGAKSRLELRSGDGVFQLLKLLGFEEVEAEAAMVFVPQRILDNNFRGAL